MKPDSSSKSGRPAKKNHNYNKLAPYYDALLLLSGGYLQRARKKLLNRLPSSGNALLLGEGTGGFLIEVYKLNIFKSIVYLDSSIRMAKIAQKKFSLYKNSKRSKNNTPGTAEVIFLCAQLECLQKRPYSFVSVNFFLDQFTGKEASAIVSRIGGIMDQGFVLCVDFEKPRTRFQKFLLKILYAFFRATCNLKVDSPPDYSSVFSQNGFVITQRMQLRFGISATLYKKDKKI